MPMSNRLSHREWFSSCHYALQNGCLWVSLGLCLSVGPFQAFLLSPQPRRAGTLSIIIFMHIALSAFCVRVRWRISHLETFLLIFFVLHSYFFPYWKLIWPKKPVTTSKNCSDILQGRNQSVKKWELMWKENASEYRSLVVKSTFHSEKLETGKMFFFFFDFSKCS